MAAGFAPDLDLLLLPAARPCAADDAAWAALEASLRASGHVPQRADVAALGPDGGLEALLTTLPPEAAALCVVAEREGAYLALALACARPGLVTALVLLHPHLGGALHGAHGEGVELGEGAQADAVLDPRYLAAPALHARVSTVEAPTELLAGRLARCPDPAAARAAMRALPNVSLTFLAMGDGSIVTRAPGRVLDDALRAAHRARPTLDPRERARRRTD